MSVASHRMCTLSQPTELIRLAVAHMQMHHESPALGGEMIFCRARPRQGETIKPATGATGAKAAAHIAPLPRLLVRNLPEVAGAPRDRLAGRLVHELRAHAVRVIVVALEVTCDPARQHVPNRCMRASGCAVRSSKLHCGRAEECDAP